MANKLQKLNQYEVAIDNGSYKALSIHPSLRMYVKSIELHLGLTSSMPYSVLPDLSVVMGFQYQGSLFLFEKEKKKRLEQCGISGLQIQPSTASA